MKKIYILLLNSTLLFASAFSQSWNIQWDKRYGTSYDDQLNAFIQTADGGFLLGGSTASGISGDKTETARGGEDFWVVKVDPLGNKQWDKRYGGSDNDRLSSFQQTSDRGYILGGYSFSGLGGDRSENSQGFNDYWVVKIDSLGNKQWDKRFGGSLDDYLYSVKQTTDGGYILGGWTYSNKTGDLSQPIWGNCDYWVVKIDASGNKQWDKRYGGTGADELFALQQTADGGYIFGGFSRSGANGDKTQAAYAGTNDYWIIKVNASGIKQWDKRFGNNGDDQLYALLQTPDHGYLLAGWSSSGLGSDKTVAGHGAADIWIIKTDSSGNKEWNNGYGGSLAEDIWNGNISMTADGGYLFGATSYSPISGNKSENDLGSEQAWIVKLTASGAVQWDKTIFTTGQDEASFVAQTKDGCYVMANYTNAGTGGYKSQANRDSANYTSDFWIVKFCDDNVMPPPPVASFDAADTSLCPGSCVAFANLSHNAMSYQWLFPGGLPSSSTDASPSGVCYYSSGSYDAKLIAYNSSGTDTLTLTNYIHVHDAPPTPVIMQMNDTLFCSSDPSYTSYQWYSNSTLIPGATNLFIVPSSGGNYNVQVTNASGCQSAVGINIILGMQQLTGNDLQLILYPNPAKNNLQLAISSLQIANGELQIYIYNMMGELCYQSASRKPQTVLNVSTLSPGLYFVHAIGDKERWMGRFVKE